MMLLDPQIITSLYVLSIQSSCPLQLINIFIDNSELGDAQVPVFADGNMATAFMHFGNFHICNMFCDYYKLLKIKANLVDLVPKHVISLNQLQPSGKACTVISIEEGEIVESGGSLGMPTKKKKVQL